MRWRTIWVLAGVLVVFTIVGCRKNEEGAGGGQTTAEQVKKQAGEAMTAAANFASEKKDEFVKTAQDKLDQLQEKYQQLKQQASVQGAEAQQKLGELETDLQTRLKTASDSLGKVKEAGENAWQTTASATQDALNKAQEAYDKIVSYVKDQAGSATQQQ